MNRESLLLDANGLDFLPVGELEGEIVKETLQTGRGAVMQIVDVKPKQPFTARSAADVRRRLRPLPFSPFSHNK